MKRRISTTIGGSVRPGLISPVLESNVSVKVSVGSPPLRGWNVKSSASKAPSVMSGMSKPVNSMEERAPPRGVRSPGN
jgi:hypothetical protein